MQWYQFRLPKISDVENLVSHLAFEPLTDDARGTSRMDYVITQGQSRTGLTWLSPAVSRLQKCRRTITRETYDGK